MKDQNYIGIDYGGGVTNIDLETGIRYGVINANKMRPDVYADFTPDYGIADDPDIEINDFSEPTSWTFDALGYNASMGEDGDIFLIKSPYYTKAAFCSPCAPGACYITEPRANGAKAYCFGPDWFEGDNAPYPVYRVADDTKV